MKEVYGVAYKVLVFEIKAMSLGPRVLALGPTAQ
jgi:hypothetical protein